MKIAGIGYQGRELDALVAALQQAHIEGVVDVRETPWSRKPGFSKRALGDRLAEAGIHYVHLRAAGNPRENRRTARSSTECLARYRAHLAADPSVLDEILELARRERIALLCYEAAAEDCHRSILLEALCARAVDLEAVAL
jgi:uncharacterized protein (DUF488 family)